MFKEHLENPVTVVTLSEIDQINDDIRLLKLVPVENPEEGVALKFLPGQWLDVYIPSIPQAGGFTITSPPSALSCEEGPSTPYLELAIRRSPSNPSAAWLWRLTSDILQSELQVRIGGSFVWPPQIYGGKSGIDGLKRVVLLAGGVGINPLMSILSHLYDLSKLSPLPFQIKLLYTLRDPGPNRNASSILFLPRITRILKKFNSPGSLELYLTGGEDGCGLIPCGNENIGFRGRRVTSEDLTETLGPITERGQTVVYICGVPAMTDLFVENASRAEGMDPRHILCERWW